MKIANAVILLGSAYLAQGAELQQSDQVKFGSDDKTLQLTNSGTIQTIQISDGLTLDCEPNHNAGTAHHDYSTLSEGAPSNLAEYEAGSKLAYLCGVVEGETLLSISEAPQGVTMSGGKRVLVKFEGSAQNCEGTLSVAKTDGDGIGDGTGIYSAEITSTLTFGCKKKHAFTTSVSADLRVKKKPEATFIAGDAPAQTQSLDRQLDGKTFEKAWTATFNLGTTAPHRAYYTSGGCDDESDICFGALKTSSDDAAAGADVATSLAATSWLTDVDVEYFHLSDCRADYPQVSGEISEWDACRATRTTPKGAQGLLTSFDCPFIDGESLSTESAVDACEAAGKSQSLFVTCESSSDANGIKDTQFDLTDADFKANLKFSGTGFFQTAPTATADPVTTQIASGTHSVDYSIDLTVTAGNVAVASELLVEELNGGVFKATPTLSGTTLSFTAPARDMNIKLTGLVKTTCEGERVEIVSSVSLSVEITTKSSGSFAASGADACDGRFVFTRGPDLGDKTMTVIGVHAPGKSVSVSDIRFCKDGSASAADCAADLPGNPQTEQAGDKKVLISKLCDGVAQDHVGGLIEVKDNLNSTDYYYAPVICPGPCGSSSLKNVKLDWEVDFAASVTDGTANNKVVANQADSMYDNSNDALVRNSFLSSNNVCGATGKVLVTIDDDVTDVTGEGCGIFADGAGRTFDKATEIIQKFKDCGNTVSDDPEVYLVQQLHVDLPGVADDEYFCHAQKLKMEVKEMTNQAVATLAQIEPSAASSAAAAIKASIRNIAYEECTEGGYKLVASIDLDTSLSGPVNYTSVGAHPPKLAAGVIADDVLTFSGASCIDVCAAGNEGFYADLFTINGKLEGNDGSELAINFDFEVLGSPCMDREEIDQGQVTLNLFGIARTNDAACNSTAEADQLSNGDVTVDHNLCASMSTTNFGNSKLKVLNAVLKRKSPGSVEEVVTHSLFAPGITLTGTDSGAKFSEDIGAGYALNYTDAFAQYTLIVDWEQQLSSRLLRTVHVFGAADNEVTSTLSILPAAAQIQDEVEAEQMSDKANEASAPSPSSEEEDDGFDWSSTEGGLVIALIVVGGLLVLVVGRFVAVALATGDFGNFERPDRKVYNKVRRSERFAISNF